MSRPKRQRSGQRPWTPGRVSYYQKKLGLTKIGDLVVGSKAVITGRIAGTEPIGIGEPGDGLQGLEQTAEFLNRYFGTSSPNRPADLRDRYGEGLFQSESNQETKFAADPVEPPALES